MNNENTRHKTLPCLLFSYVVINNEMGAVGILGLIYLGSKVLLVCNLYLSVRYSCKWDSLHILFYA